MHAPHSRPPPISLPRPRLTIIAIALTPLHWTTLRSRLQGRPSPIVKLIPLPQLPVRARTDARTNSSAQRATQLRSVLARV
jgi:hypothetical protein